MKKNKAIQAVKGIATYLVVMVHAGNIVSYANLQSDRMLWIITAPLKLFAATGVPLFFVISSYLLFSHRCDYRTNVHKKVRTLLIPYFIFNSFWILFELLGGIPLPQFFNSVIAWNAQDWMRAFVTEPFYKPFWFIRDLFLLNLLAPLIGVCIRKVPFLSEVGIIGLWYTPLPSDARQAIVFFGLGAILAIHGQDWVKKWQTMQFSITQTLATVFGGGALVLLYWTGELLSLKIVSRTAILGMVAIVACVAATQAENWAVQKCTRQSFVIYAMHGKILSILQIICTSAIVQTRLVVVVEYLVLPAVVIVGCISFGTVFQRLWPRAYAICTGGR